MKNLSELSRRDLERLSAYLDGELSQKESTRLEARLRVEPTLRDAFKELKLTSRLVSSLPEVRPPRNFTLSPEMVGVREKRSMYPIFRFATVVAAVAFAILVGADTFFLSESGMMSDMIPAAAPEVMLEEAPKEVFEAAEAPVEALVEEPMAIEAVVTPTLELENEILEEGEVDRAQGEEPLRAPDGDTQEYGLEGTEIRPTEPWQNVATVSPEGTPIASEEAAQDAISPTEEGQASPLVQPSPTDIPIIEDILDQPGLSLEPILIAEVGLGIAALLLAGITIYLRKQR
jgi:hypothetical protein